MSLEKTDLKIVLKEVTGDIHIITDTQFNNIHAGYVTVNENVTARLLGDIKEKLILKKGSKVYLHGNLYGEIENLSGEFHIHIP